MIRWPMLLLLAPLSVLAETSVYTEQGIVTENQTVKEVTDFLLDKVLQSTPSNTVAEKNLDPDDRKSLEAVRERRPRVNLGALGIAPGDQLTFSRDDAIVTIVVPDGKVNFDGEIMSLSAAALKALNRMGYTTTSASGSEYWMFDGETIDERRRRLEAEKFDQSSENMN